MADMASFSELRARLVAAREEYQRALEAQTEAIEFRSSKPDPDGMQLMYHANSTLSHAFAQYTEALTKLTDYVLNRTEADPSGTSALNSGHGSAEFPNTVHVLLVEDNTADVRLLQEVVAHGSVQVKVTVANNCAGAVGAISDRFKPHVVIADLSALEFGGVELMKRCNPHGVPVVVFSGSINPKDKEHVLCLGAKEFVAKPSSLDEYREAVWMMIGKWTKRNARREPLL